MQNPSRSDRRSINKDGKPSYRHHSHRPKHRHSSEAGDYHGDHTELEHGITNIKKRVDSEKESALGEHFTSDRKGDPAILQFGTNHSYGVPRYGRTGYGHVLGLARSLKIDRAASTVKEIGFISSDPTHRARNKHVFANVAHEHDHMLPSFEVISDSELTKNYLVLDDRQQGSDNAGLSDDSDSPDYRKALKKVNGGKQDHETNDRAARVEVSKSLVNRTTWDNRVKSDPSDGQAWLELIKRQNHQSAGRQTRAERISSAEIKMSMYEKALKHVTGPLKEDLLRGLLREAEFVLDKERLDKKWQDIWRKNRHSFGICRDYINYHQTKSARFQFDDLRTAYKEALASIGDHEFGQGRHPKSPSDSSVPGKHALYLLLRYTLSLRQAGYPEQAIAIWQATLEGQFNTTATKHSENALEKFWESEVPRIGETNAQGISHYVDHGGNVPIEKEDPPRDGDGPHDIPTWLEGEEMVEKLLPARTGDITDEEDAFRVVLFADIQPFLLGRSDISNESLLNAFLLFIGLPPLWQDETASWVTDPFIFDIQPAATYRNDSTESNTTSKPYRRFFSSSSCRITTDTLFSSSTSPFDCFPDAGSKIFTSQAVLHWSRNVLRYLVDLVADGTHLALLEYYLAFELKFFPQEVRKISKRYLKQYPQALLLYNTHGLIEFRVGTVESAKKVLETAITMRSSDPEIVLLSRTLAWETLESSMPSLALEYLLGASKAHDEMAIFEQQRSFLASMDKAVRHEQHLVPSYMDCLLLLGYLSNPDPLSAALSIFRSHLAFIASKMVNHVGCIEGLHQSLARLLYYHMQHRPYKPSTIRTIIRQSMAAFPANTIFLSLFHLNEQRFRINDRVRSVVRDILSHGDDEAVGTSSPAISHAVAIHAETSRWMGLGSSLDSIRSAFERAVEDEETAKCPTIWRQYAEFELSQGNATTSNKRDRQRTQSVILRAIAACPWVRQFYLTAIRYFYGELDEEGCNGAYSMMMERELRVRSSLY